MRVDSQEQESSIQLTQRMPTCSRWVILCCLRYYASRRPSNENCVEDEMMLNRKILEFSHLPIRGRNARDLQ